MENGKTIKIELFPDIAPNTVRNFLSLSNKGFYNGLTFHRVIPGFMIQGGDPKGNGTGGPDYSIFGEFNSNGFNNPLKHTRGVISMARSKSKNSAGSQFFIMHEDYPSLDGEYAAFGNVIEGLDVVDEIATVEKGANDKPVNDVKIKTITVETFGVNYKEVEKYNK
ncbi:peptidylprolyl isomerase [Clostridium punense]